MTITNQDAKLIREANEIAYRLDSWHFRSLRGDAVPVDKALFDVARFYKITDELESRGLDPADHIYIPDWIGGYDA